MAPWELSADNSAEIELDGNAQTDLPLQGRDELNICHNVECSYFTFLDEYSFSQLCHNDQVEDDWSSEKRVFTSVVQYHSVGTTHEDLRGVLVHGTLAITNIRNIFNHNLQKHKKCVWFVVGGGGGGILASEEGDLAYSVIWMLSWLFVKDLVGFHHVINNIALGDFL